MNNFHSSLVFILSIFSGALFFESCISSEKIDENTQKNEKLNEDTNNLQNEIRYGRQLAGKLIKYFGLLNNIRASKYVNNVGNYLARQSQFTNQKFMFEILNSDSINAFSCPGGYIFITKGALVHIQNEAELAMVLSHEIIHVGNKHMLQTLEQNQSQKKEKIQKDDNFLNARKRPDVQQNKVNEQLSKFLIGSSGSGLSLIEGLQQGVSLMFRVGFDKSLEFEADKLGLQIAVNSGYNPIAIRDFFLRLNHNKSEKFKILSKTHPPVTDRLTHIAKDLLIYEENNTYGVRVENRYKKNINFERRL